MSCQLTPYGEYADPELCGQQCLVMGLPATLNEWTFDGKTLDFSSSTPTVKYDAQTGFAWMTFQDEEGAEYGIRRVAFNEYYDRVTTLDLDSRTMNDVYVLRHAQLSLNTIIDSINPTSMNQFFGGC